MQIAALLLLALFYLGGFAAIFFTSIGTLLILIGALLYAFMTRFEVLTIMSLILLLGLYLLGELVEFFLGFLGARSFGASARAAWAGMAGGLIGALIGSIFFGIGVFLGTLIGIFVGILVVEIARHRDWKRALTAGTGGLLGRLGAIGVKVIIAVAMGGIIFYRLIQHSAFAFP